MRTEDTATAPGAAAMSRPLPAPLETPVRRARRRLFLQLLVNRLVGGWAGALALAVGWFLLQPFLLAAPAAGLRWAVAGTLVTAATALAGGGNRRDGERGEQYDERERRCLHGCVSKSLGHV